MNLTNRLTLADLVSRSASELATSPADQLALLQEDVEGALTVAKSAKERLDDALALKYGARASEMRRLAGKDSGTVRLEDGAVTVIADLPKRVDWDQTMLADLAQRIRNSGDDPAQYLDITLKVPERKYAAWPSAIRDAFAAARTLRAGKPSFHLELRAAEEAR